MAGDKVCDGVEVCVLGINSKVGRPGVLAKGECWQRPANMVGSDVRYIQTDEGLVEGAAEGCCPWLFAGPDLCLHLHEVLARVEDAGMSETARDGLVALGLRDELVFDAGEGEGQ
jgi:hypothetical protein